MTLTAGSRLGPYEILAPIGAGGMGEVWRAKDLKLDREVAIKVLPARLSNDPAALARFEREAKAVASLSHPNILAIHDFGSSSGEAFAVMELLEGETLRERLEVGALPARKALDYAIQIANGLAAAHEKGIVHRDLKPENLFVTGDGRVKILDFGLAKVAERALDATTSPTVAAGSGTEPGTLMGSVGYMSPEQVRGAPADHRSDIFSFGAVLYEMLTGVRAFRRDTSAETMTAILKDDPPDFPTSSGAISPALLRIVEHCMEKNPQERFQSARDLAFDLGNVTGISAESADGAPSRVSGSGRGRRVLTILSLLFAGALVGAAIATRLRPAAETEPVRIHSLTFSSHDSEPSASPDGRLIAFTSWRDGQSRIWIKQITGGGEVPLTAGSDRRPRFSPDGSSVLFIRDLGTSQAVYRVPLVGGDVHKLIDNAVDADWAPDGRRIAFVRIRKGGGANGATLLVLDTETGKETSLLQEKDDGMFGPRWSPDGRSIAIARGNRNRNSASWMLLRIDSETGRMLPIPQNGPGNALGGIAWSGRGREMFFVQSASVMGDISGAGSRILRLDLSTGKRTTLLWADGLATVNGTEGAVTLCDVLSSGRLLFSERMRRQNLREITLGPAGAVGAPRLLTSGSSIDRQPVYSPDGKRLLFSSNRSGNLDLWVIEPATGISKQLTDDAAQDWDPAFTPDGAHILWSCDRHGHLEAWIANADGSGARQLSDDGADAENPTETRDGKWIVYWSGNSKKAGIWKIHPDGTGATRLVSGSFVATEVSPDGRYCLFNDQDQSNLRGVVRCVEIESGRVLPFAIPVPYTLGAPGIIYGRARWSPDGRSIYFIGQDAAGLSGVFAQEFSPERDTTSTRHPVAGFSNEYVTESLGLSPDGTRLTISTGQEFGTIMLADGVTGAAPPARKAP